MAELSIIEKADNYVFELFKESNKSNLIFHDYKHTTDVVKAAIEIGKASELSDDQIEILTLAAWFHDAGYLEKCEGHEKISSEIAKKFLEGENYSREKIGEIVDCILVTELGTKPVNLLQEVMCDADTLNVGTLEYPIRSKLLRAERELMSDRQMLEIDWLKTEVEFLNNHWFYTRYMQLNYNEAKAKNIIQRQSEFQKLTQKIKNQNLKNTEREVKSQRSEVPNRGIETMFRTTLRNHINLSAIADNKANLMLSINAIIISIIISVLVPNYKANPEFNIPAGFLLLVCLLSIIFATLSTRPKVTRGTFTKDDINNKKANLLFFGNFFNTSLEEFEWGMGEMMKDRDFLYGSMVRDLHSLGKVLNKKYRFLRITYYIFMYGMILSVLLFGVFISLNS